MKVSPHLHIEDHLTGSTLQSFVDKAKELNRTYFSLTSHGHLSSALKAYNLAKKNKLNPIVGIEVYFKDSNCPIIAGTSVDRCKYFTLSIFAEDQEAYQELCKIVSQPMPTIQLYEKDEQLWSWKDLEKISKFNVNIVLGGLHCIVSKPALAGNPELGEKVLVKLKELFPGRLNLSLICEPFSKKFNSIIEIKHPDGTRSTCLSTDLVTTDRARRIRATDLIEREGHKVLKTVYSNSTFKDIGLPIDKAILHKGFLPLPGGDAMLTVNKFLKDLSEKYSLPLLVSDYAYYAEKDDKVVQTMKLEGNNKLHSNFHMKEISEIKEYLLGSMELSLENIDKTLENNEKWAKRFDKFELSYSWRLAESKEDSLRRIMAIIRENGRMDWSNPVWVDRLKEELNVIAKNGKMDMSAYFLPIHDVIAYYRANGKLCGPARGSAAGSLLAYLLGITEIDPFLYDLSFSRFFSLDRIFANKIADIDSDLEDRELLVGKDGKSGYLYERWGNCAAQISTRQNIRLKSAIKDVNRYFKGKVDREIEILTKGLPDAPQGVSDEWFVFGYIDDEGNRVPGLLELSGELQKYTEQRPEEWNIVRKALGIVRAYSTHACAFLISDCPISDIVPIKEGHITQYEAKDVEAAGLVKMDFLVVSQLKDIRLCLDLINKKNGQQLEVGNFAHKGIPTNIWRLPEDPEVYRSIWGGSTETCFQINTKSMIPFVKDILPRNIEDLSLILSLVRPGPLDFVNPETGRNMAQEYVHRRNGGSYEDIKILQELIPQTLGVLCYQEQVTKIAKEVSGFSGLEAENLREAIGKKNKEKLLKLGPKFIQGVIDSGKTTESEAKELWNRIETFGRYAFNKSHSISYSHITYACMFLKYHYPLEWWASILTNAEEKEITGKLWPYVKEMVLPPDINLSSDVMAVDYSNNKIRAKLGIIRGVGDATIEPILANRPYKDIQDFVNKEVTGQSLARKLTHVGVLDSLYPSKTNLMDKFKLLENAFETKSYNDKVKVAESKGKKTKATQPKEGFVPEEYVNLHPFKDAAMKKAVLPSMPIDLFKLGSKYSKVLAPFEEVPAVTGQNGYSTRLVDGERLRRLDEMPGELVNKDIYVAATCFVVEASEFSYPKANPTKRALKLVIDSDGYTSEKVLWPDYDSGQLTYSPELKKGCIATFFLRKRIGKKDMSITNIVVET